MASSDPKENEDDISSDLVKEREVFVRSFLKRGVELTEELIRENSELREELESLRAENANFRNYVARDEVIRNLLRAVENLEHEKKALLEKSVELEETRRRQNRRYETIEQELNELANLYIASYQLHASLSVRRVLRHLHDVLNQFVGARRFVIYAVEPDGKTVMPIASAGASLKELTAIPMGKGPIGEACSTGVAVIREPLTDNGDNQPVAVIPLVVEGKAVGAIAILTLLQQKTSWESVDKELFRLLGDHAGSALVAANFFAKGPDSFSALVDEANRIQFGDTHV